MGYLEYGMALSQLDRLLNAASAEEMRIVEEIVAERPELSVYTNLSRRIEPRPSPLSEAPGHQGDDFRRLSLAWVMALARVELGAMAAGFTEEKDPFALARPGKYELPAYVELLADGMRSHYWSLQSDRVAKDPRRAGLTDSQAIAYVRRVHVASSFLRAFRDLAKAQLNQAQTTELRRWENDLEELKRTLLFDVLKLGTQLVHSGQTQRVKSRQLKGGQDVPDAALADLPDCVANAVRDLDATAQPAATPP